MCLAGKGPRQFFVITSDSIFKDPFSQTEMSFNSTSLSSINYSYLLRINKCNLWKRLKMQISILKRIMGCHSTQTWVADKSQAEAQRTSNIVTLQHGPSWIYWKMGHLNPFSYESAAIWIMLFTIYSLLKYIKIASTWTYYIEYKMTQKSN